jgi:hypothetical protein
MDAVRCVGHRVHRWTVAEWRVYAIRHKMPPARSGAAVKGAGGTAQRRAAPLRAAGAKGIGRQALARISTDTTQIATHTPPNAIHIARSSSAALVQAYTKKKQAGARNPKYSNNFTASVGVIIVSSLSLW